MSDTDPWSDEPRSLNEKPAEPPLPDPNGSPQPVNADDCGPLESFFAKACWFVAAGGTLLTMVGSVFTPCVGATRSSKLTWQAREAEIHAAQQLADAEREPK